jgi:hypothetical protein
LSLWLLYFTNKKIHNVIFKHKWKGEAYSSFLSFD